MRLLSAVFVYFLAFQVNVLAELSSRSCSLLRTTTTLTTIFPELAQLAIRSYRISLPTIDESTSINHRQKRFLTVKDTSSGSSKGTLLEQMAANAFKDMNFTKVAILILNNNETMNKLRQNIDWQTILRAIMQDIDYEQLGRTFYFALENEFDLEYLVSSFVNLTHFDTIYDALILNETLPDWLITSLHPDLNVPIVQQMFNSLKDSLKTLKTNINDAKHFDEFLFNLIQKKTLLPLENIVRKIKNQNPATLDQLVNIILEDINKIVMEQFPTTTIKPLSSTNVTAQNDVKLLLYQCSIAIDSFGQTARMILKSLEQLYCTSVWE